MMEALPMNSRSAFLVMPLLAGALAWSCATDVGTEPGPDAMSAPVAAGVPSEAAPPDDPEARLRALAIERARTNASQTYLIGPGDLLSVTVFDLPELNRKVRVGSNGIIQLPLIGSMKAAGLDESELASAIATRLSGSYLQNPQVDVFVEEYKSQQVAVTGSVTKPGLYPLTRERYTILDMLSEAGGLSRDAGPVIEFIPARGGKSSPAFAVASLGNGVLPPEEQGDNLAAGGLGQGISIDLNGLLKGINRTALNIPMMAGDVIFIPEAGTFTIEGWVDKPGTYPLNRTTTVLAALSAGGGSLFPSRLGNVQILRSSGATQEGRQIIGVDLNSVREGREADVLLRSGDIVRVPAWKTLVLPWSAYYFVRSLISIGASIPII